METIYSGFEMSQKLQDDGFKSWNDKFNFDEKFIKFYDGDSNKEYIFELGAKYPKNSHDSQNDLPFLPERMNIKKYKNLFVICITKKIYCVYKNLKTSLKSWTITKKSVENNKI